MAPAKKTATRAASTEKPASAKEAPAKRGRKPAAATADKGPVKKVSYTSYVQLGESTFDITDVVSRAESAFKNDNKRKRYDEFRVYIKPEDSKAYYVAKYGDKEYRDSIDL